MSSSFTNSFHNQMNLRQESQFSFLKRYHACEASTQTTIIMETMIRNGSQVFRNPQTLEKNKNNIVIICHMSSYGYHMVISHHKVITYHMSSSIILLSHITWACKNIIPVNITWLWHITCKTHIIWLPYIIKYNTTSKHHLISLKVMQSNYSYFIYSTDIAKKIKVVSNVAAPSTQDLKTHQDLFPL